MTYYFSAFSSCFAFLSPVCLSSQREEQKRTEWQKEENRKQIPEV
jgi:hypothetical protein